LNFEEPNNCIHVIVFHRCVGTSAVHELSTDQHYKLQEVKRLEESGVFSHLQKTIFAEVQKRSTTDERNRIHPDNCEDDVTDDEEGLILWFKRSKEELQSIEVLHSIPCSSLM